MPSPPVPASLRPSSEDGRLFRLFASLLLAGLLLAGCTLIDQRTFRAAAPAAGPGELARAGLPALPLITVRFDQPVDRAAIAEAADLARARRADATFDVIVPVPAGARGDALAQGQADASAVARALAESGVARERIEIGARADGIAGIREIRVYVR